MTEASMPHELRLKDRSTLTMTGVKEVVSFDEGAVVLQTSLGMLLVQGRELHLKTLSPEGGQVEIEGTVTALSYEEPRSGGWRQRLFG